MEMGASDTAFSRRLTDGQRALRKLEHDRENAGRTERAGDERDVAPPA
jgi:hypothetical protein